MSVGCRLRFIRYLVDVSVFFFFFSILLNSVDSQGFLAGQQKVNHPRGAQVFGSLIGCCLLATCSMTPLSRRHIFDRLRRQSLEGLQRDTLQENHEEGMGIEFVVEDPTQAQVQVLAS